jgi:chlorobactene glucosyltransferase
MFRMTELVGPLVGGATLPGLTTPSTVLLIVYFLIVLGGQGVPVVLAYLMPELGPAEEPPPSPAPRVSVIIPTRNEALDLGVCLDDLQAQDYGAGGGSLEVLVIDGGSTDGTADIARAHPLRPTVIPEPPLPTGWVGKSFACYLGAKVASGERLLFLDADVRLAPSTLRVALATQDATKADLLSLATRIEMKSFWERVVLPLTVQFILTYFVTPRVNRDGSSRAMANGQFLLFRRESYERIGGHLAVRGDILEDVRLAQEVKARGGRVRVYWAPDLVWTRMYRNRTELHEGLLKNLHGTRFSAPRQAAFLLGILAFFLSPFALLGYGIWNANLSVVLVAGALLILTLAKQVGFQRALRASPWYALLYPLGCLYYVVLLLESIGRGLRGRSVTWKGRSYDMEGGGFRPPGAPGPPGNS